MLSHSKKTKLLLFLLLVLIVGAVPAHAHAWCWSDVITPLPCDLGSTIGNYVLDGIFTVLTLLQGMLLKLIVLLGATLTKVLDLRTDGGGAVVGATWRVLRDFCNMAFIVVIILTSFGTIFDTFKIGFLGTYTLSNKKLISGFLIAAIFMNFSLAIGQAIVGITNQITLVMAGIMPKDIGNQVANELQVAALAAGGTPAADPGNPAAQPAAQPATAAVIPANQKLAANTAWQRQFLMEYVGCYNTAPWWYDCLTNKAKNSPKIPYPEVATAAQKDLTLGGNPPAMTKTANGNYVFAGAANTAIVSAAEANTISAAETIRKGAVEAEGARATAAKAAAAGSTSDKAAEIMGTIYSIFLLLVLALSFLSVVVFMLVRIPFVWVILVLSPLAWVGRMFNNSWWSQWWTQFMAWNLFSPMYLFMIYFGLYMLAQQNTILAELAQSSGFWDKQLGILMFYVMTATIFVGGSAAVVSFAFQGGSYASKAFDRISGGLGITGKTGAVGAVYRGTPGLAWTGRQFQAAGERVGQVGGNISASLRGRAPAFFGTEAESMAAAQKRFGVRAGASEVAKLQKERIDTQQKILQQRVDLKTLDDAGLKKMLSSGNRDLALAAGEMLMAKGKLGPGELLEMERKYAKISPVALSGFNDRMVTQLIGDAGKKKFDTLSDMEAYMDLIKDNKKAKEFYDAALNGKNKVMAIEAGATRGLITDPRTGTRISFNQAMEREAKNFKTSDFLDAEERYGGSANMPPVVAEAYRKTVSDRNKSEELLQSTTSGAQTARVYSDLTTEAQRVQTVETNVDSIEKTQRKIKNKVSELRNRVKKAPPVDRKKLTAAIEALENKSSALNKQVGQLKRTI